MYVGIVEKVRFYTTARGQLGVVYNGQKYYRSYGGSGGLVSWVCRNKHVCSRRIKTLGQKVVSVSSKAHSNTCIELDLQDSRFLRTNKGTTMLLYNGLRYSRNYQNRDKVSYRCNKGGCLARVTTFNNRIKGPRHFAFQGWVSPSCAWGLTSTAWSECGGLSPSGGAANPLVFGITKFGNPIITWGNYRFIKKLARRVKTWWECTARKSSGCRCVAVTVNDRLVKLNGWHNH
ncbi:hypothetical protein B5X24_HaOG203934 [Helicoverpa armigera]|uniref:FLYWCH-type domain-containing protein n=1 Tax=Helicoverpa armigera TaxID=29058 RepID=A0A2W1BYX6_HELAM|nr:hypothetical protein B5X24_HaOG203934 [Helicoverpa armigera]